MLIAFSSTKVSLLPFQFISRDSFAGDAMAIDPFGAYFHGMPPSAIPVGVKNAGTSASPRAVSRPVSLVVSAQHPAHQRGTEARTPLISPTKEETMRRIRLSFNKTSLPHSSTP